MPTTDCPECDGLGYVSTDNGPSPKQFTCEWCGGTGTVTADDISEE